VAVSRQFRDYVTDLFAPFGEVEIRLMFGGAGIYHKDQMFALIADERIYLKVNDETRPAFEAEGSKPFVFEMKSGELAAMSYLELPPRLLDDPDELQRWARRAYEAAIASRGNKHKPRKNAPPPDLPLVSPRKNFHTKTRRREEARPATAPRKPNKE
jgi:DNA transformation protein